MLNALGIEDTPYLVDDVVLPSEDPRLQTGVLLEGSASGTTGSAHCDESLGTYYGNGRRNEHVEDYGMTKVPSRQDR